MGTNYYLEPRESLRARLAKWLWPIASAYTPRIHLGKQSGGWRFLFQAQGHWGDGGTEGYGFIGDVRTVSGWVAFVSRHLRAGWEIRDEYGRRRSLPEMLDAIAAVKDRKHEIHDGHYWVDPDGYWFSDHEFS